MLTNVRRKHGSVTRSLRSSFKMSPTLTLLLLVTTCHRVLGAFSFRNISSGLPHPCDSKIYCYGELLKTVQLAELHEDSKYFVDMKLKYPPSDVYEKFLQMMVESQQNPSRQEVAQFVEENFDNPGAEFSAWEPDDWEESPAFLDKIKDERLKAWGSTLNVLWKDLGRKISSLVAQEPEKYSQIFVNNPVVVPGGRFREFYYWDSYWTIDGLLLSGMRNTVKGMLENFLQMVEQYGLVPNGGRVYYTRRSQPPYLLPMMKLYVDHTHDLEFVRRHIDTLEKEVNFWLRNRSTEVSFNEKNYTVILYNSRVDDPRPESFREDYKAVESLPESERSEMYVQYKSGAESGWDYSSRWFINSKKGGSNDGTLADLAVTSIAPVDLNSLLCYNLGILSSFYKDLGHKESSVRYQVLRNQWLETLTELFWHEDDGIWYDINIRNMTKRRYFYISNLHPLWTGSFDQSPAAAKAIVGKVIAYLKAQNVLNYIGGVPTSKQNTGQQWDYPNAWAPHQHLVVTALQQNKDRHPEADGISFQLAEKWVQSNYQGYVDVKAMFEKYNVNICGAPGGGGEYNVQVGFGWTNGVAMRFLNDFGDRLEAPPSETSSASSMHPTNNLMKALFLLPVMAAPYVLQSMDVL